jgi:hypothetical protein
MVIRPLRHFQTLGKVNPVNYRDKTGMSDMTLLLFISGKNPLS